MIKAKTIQINIPVALENKSEKNPLIAPKSAVAVKI
jgi:hypothetical protein